MSAILNVILPVFGIILAGYLCGRFRLLGEASSEALNAFVYFVALPALFFVSIARVPIGDILNLPFLTAFIGGILLVGIPSAIIARWAFPDRISAVGLHALAATFSNTGYMGIPLLITAFGEQAALPAIIATVVMGAVVMPVGIAIVEADLSEGSSAVHIAWDVLLGVLRSPLVLAAAGGMLVSILRLPLPATVGTFCDILGAAAPPCALFAMGLFMVGRTITRGGAEIAWATALKLIAQPVVTWWLAFEVLDMDALWAAAAVTLAALPTGSLVFVLAHRYGIYTRRATAVILLSTVLSVLTLSALFAVLGVR
jgi:predicted permease